MSIPEKEPKLEIPEVRERPVVPEIPPEVERVGVKPRITQFTSQITNDTKKRLMNSSNTQAQTISIPADPEKLSQWSAGSPNASLTWFASFWIRMIKKALHFGWKVVKGEF